MHTASKSLKKAHQDLDVDKIADLMDDIQEQQDVSTYSRLYQSGCWMVGVHLTHLMFWLEFHNDKWPPIGLSRGRFGRI